MAPLGQDFAFTGLSQLRRVDAALLPFSKGRSLGHLKPKPQRRPKLRFSNSQGPPFNVPRYRNAVVWADKH